jgi:hypothetical protein
VALLARLSALDSLPFRSGESTPGATVDGLFARVEQLFVLDALLLASRRAN